MKRRIQKWGNSLALRIPRSFAEEVGIEKETPVEIVLADGRLVITPLTGTEPTIEQLLDGITPDNLHHEVDAAAATGNEAW